MSYSKINEHAHIAVDTPPVRWEGNRAVRIATENSTIIIFENEIDELVTMLRECQVTLQERAE